MSASLRPAGESDAEAVAHVHAISRSAYYEAGGVLMPVDSVVGDDYLAFWSKALTVEACRAWIAEAAGQCVGFLVAGPPVHPDLLGQPVLELIGLFLLPRAWGTGLADELHGHFTEALRATGLEGALDVWAGNLRAMAFYRRHGWGPDGRQRPGPGDQPFLGLRLSLSS